jgi:tetratricopeptide (TPR) repeat protein
MTAAELLEQGIRAYTRGALEEAERCWTSALDLEPHNDRARSYLDVLVAKRGAASREPAVPLPAPVSRAVPLPPPAAVPPAPSPPHASAPAAPIPLPGPPAAHAGWMQPPAAPAPEATAPPPATARASGGSSASGAESEAPPAGAAPAAPPPPRREDRPSYSEYAASPWDEGPALAPAVVLQDGDGLDLATVAEQSDLRPLVPESPTATPVPRPPPRSDVEVWMDGARELFALGDFSGSLEMIEKILKVDPHHTEARVYLEQNEATLTSMYESKLGPQDAIPRLAIQPEEVMWLNLDHRAGFLLAQIDGTVSYEDLFALSGLPRLDTARILATLLQEGVITS